jgi:hypothetical protein
MPGKTSKINDIDELARQFPEVAAARDYGIDIQMLLDNLERPVEERIRRHQIALDTFRMLREAEKL